MGHNHCKLTAVDAMAAYQEAEPDSRIMEIGEDDEQYATDEVRTRSVDELWYIRHGMVDVVAEWSQTFDQKADPRATEIVTESTRLNIMMVFERPRWDQVNVVTIENMMDDRGRIMPDKQDGTHRMLVGLYHKCKTHTFPVHGAYTKDNLKEWAAAVASIRHYALLPLDERQTVDIDVADIWMPGKKPPPGPKAIPNMFIIKWRKRMGTHDREPVGKEVPWTHRWLVRKHFRKLKSGRIVPVREHVKGPEDKPLVLKQAINELRK